MDKGDGADKHIISEYKYPKKNLKSCEKKARIMDRKGNY